MKKKIKVIGLIPSRLRSSRLRHKPLLKLGSIPMVIHTYFRAKLSKELDDVILKVCKHEFIRIKENGIYSETFYKCKHCGIYR